MDTSYLVKPDRRKALARQGEVEEKPCLRILASINKNSKANNRDRRSSFFMVIGGTSQRNQQKAGRSKQWAGELAPAIFNRLALKAYFRNFFAEGFERFGNLWIIS
jgi:hypothetical protein